MLLDFTVSQATGTAERDTVPEHLDGLRERGYRPRSLGAGRGYDTKDCVRDIRARRTSHVARKKEHLALDGRTTRRAGYVVSLRLRKRVEEVFGWIKTVGGFRCTRYWGVDRTGRSGYLVATAYNLVRVAKLLSELETSAGPPSRGFCAPFKCSKGSAEHPKPAPWSRDGGFRGLQYRFRASSWWLMVSQTHSSAAR